VNIYKPLSLERSYIWPKKLVNFFRRMRRTRRRNRKKRGRRKREGKGREE
jgi:hypothetical protein